VGHIEAGLRSFNLYEPYPEEFNRKVISTFSNIIILHLLPSRTQNLLQEGLDGTSIFEVGNTIVDMVELVKAKNKNSIDKMKI
jgi:UDP-N-acetylglucosamine 2-epimerase (non-hydrolysing)